MCTAVALLLVLLLPLPSSARIPFRQGPLLPADLVAVRHVVRVVTHVGHGVGRVVLRVGLVVQPGAVLQEEEEGKGERAVRAQAFEQAQGWQSEV